MGLPAGVLSGVGRGEPLVEVPVADTVVGVVVAAGAASAAAAEKDEEDTNSTTAPTSMSARERMVWLVAILLTTGRTEELF
jgi:repressor of nif and glnA expression